MAPLQAHECRFRGRIVWLGWEQEGSMRERLGRTRAVCPECQRTRPVRRELPPNLVEREAIAPSGLALDLDGRVVAQLLLRRAGVAPQRQHRYASVLNEANRRGISASEADTWVDRLLRAGCLNIQARRKAGRWEPTRLAVSRPDHLEELLTPGGRADRMATLEEARRATSRLAHPVAAEVSRALSESSAERMDPRVVRAMAAVAAHAETGEILSANVFSARHLGSAKELRRVRGRVERLLGNLEALGIRDGAAILLLGGVGTLSHEGAPALELQRWRPFVAVAREMVPGIAFVLPPEGLLVVENLAVFEACCRGEVRGTGDWLFVWSAGYPGRAVRAVVERARKANVPVRVWADLDLDGVRIARLVHSWAVEVFQPYRMAPEELMAASSSQPIGTRALARIDSDLAANPTLLLVETLRAIRNLGRWVEQEALLL